jgi:hypothetical protein
MSASATLSTYAFAPASEFEAKRFEQSSAHGVTTFSGISPFHVPKAIEVRIASPEEATLSFVYENEEPAETASRSIGHLLEVQLGEKSKKVLTVTIRGDVLDRFKRRDWFSTSYTDDLMRSAPPSAAFSLRKNAELISSLLANLPTAFVDEILHACVQQGLSDRNG